MSCYHVDLFSNIGGFALAAEANGLETVLHCEVDPVRRRYLELTWPDVPVVEDVRNADKIERIIAGRPIRLLTAGVPCQPASRAGKQRGKDDDRWLWPSAIEVCRRLRPGLALFENPPGIGDVGLAGILSGLADLGYEVRVVGIPACAVGAPHRRERYWILCFLADATEAGLQGPNAEPGSHGCGAERITERVCMFCGYPFDHELLGKYGCPNCLGEGIDCEGDSCGFWDDYAWAACESGVIRRVPRESFSLVDGADSRLVAALGDSVVWQVAAEVIGAMLRAEKGAQD